MRVADLVGTLRNRDDCEVRPASGLPITNMPLPPDIESFYRLCGGVTLYRDSAYSIGIVPPSEFLRANPIIVGDDGMGDISFDWFVIAKSGEQCITIDLNNSRLGRCYDSFWDRHGVPGECAIIAESFESLFEQLLRGYGQYWYWLRDNFQSLGDAYDQ